MLRGHRRNSHSGCVGWEKWVLQGEGRMTTVDDASRWAQGQTNNAHHVNVDRICRPVSDTRRSQPMDDVFGTDRPANSSTCPDPTTAPGCLLLPTTVCLALAWNHDCLGKY